jgi:16S rRNA (cytidine1402-2'-O)-methyltransferase
MPGRTGTLFLVSTPIGNLEDITFRALRVLKESDIIAAEDTRKTGMLLQHYSITNRMISYHSHNQKSRLPVLMQKLCEGSNIALVSDAGTPGISDPAFDLVRTAVASSVPVRSIPGASAVITALTVSGLPTDRFVFEGFLPVKKGRRTRIKQLADERRTIVLYESPHRLLRTLQDLFETLGNRSIAVCREMTKTYEEIVRGPLSDVMGVLSARKTLGEFVLIIEGYKKTNANKTFV